MSTDSELHCIVDVHAVLGEGPVWVARENALYWLDIKGLKIFRLDDQSRLTTWPTPMRVGSIAPRKKGGFIAGTEDGIAAIDLDTGRFEIVADPEARSSRQPLQRWQVGPPRPILGRHNGRPRAAGERDALSDRPRFVGLPGR